MSNLVKVKDVIERVNTKEDRFNTDRLYYVGGEHFQSRALTVDDRGIIKGSTIGPMFYYGFKSNDFLLVSRNPHLRKAGLVNFDGICSEKTFVLHTKDERILLQKFMPFIFQNERFWKYAIANKHGSTNFFVNWSTLADYSFELPSIEQQKAISKLLWALNDTKKAYEDLIQKTDELVKSQFIEMFGDPLSDEYSDAFTNLESIFEKPQAGEWGKDDINGDGIPVLRTTNFTDEGYLTYDDVVTRDIDRDKVTHKFLQPGDILIEKSGGSGEKPVGRVVLFEGDADHYLSNNFTARLHLNGKYKINRLYVFFFMFVNYRRGGTKLYEGKTTGIHNLRLDEYLKNTSIPIPPMEVQSAFEDLVKQSDKSKFELNEAIKDLDAMYKRIIKDNLG